MTHATLLEELLTAKRLAALIELERRTAEEAERTMEHYARIRDASRAAAAVMQERLTAMEDVTGLERELGIDVELHEGARQGEAA